MAKKKKPDTIVSFFISLVPSGFIEKIPEKLFFWKDSRGVQIKGSATEVNKFLKDNNLGKF
jgi:hypothetical protein